MPAHLMVVDPSPSSITCVTQDDEEEESNLVSDLTFVRVPCALAALPHAQDVKSYLKSANLLSLKYRPARVVMSTCGEVNSETSADNKPDEASLAMAFPLVTPELENEATLASIKRTLSQSSSTLDSSMVLDIKIIRLQPFSPPGRQQKKGKKPTTQKSNSAMPPSSHASRAVDSSSFDVIPRIPCPHNPSSEWFYENVVSHRKPVILTNAVQMKEGFQPAAILQKINNTQDSVVRVHVCPNRVVDLAGHRAPNTKRNFAFVDMPLAEAIERCAATNDEAYEPILDEKERYYVRSVGKGKTPSDVYALFPSLAADITIPDVRPREQLHSTVLRLSGARGGGEARLWAHFDTMDNLLVQLAGQKCVALWPPECDEDMSPEGTSSRIEEPDEWNVSEHPRYAMAAAERLDCNLSPGEALWLPALWYHRVAARGFSAAINAFWHGAVPEGEHPAGDTYGNKPPLAASRAATRARAAASDLAVLPSSFRVLYGRRAAAELVAALGILPSQVPRAPAASRLPAGRGSIGCVPTLGVGTWKLSGAAARVAVTTALGIGYRHVDCAPAYRNEVAVGEAIASAIAAGSVVRHDLFVTSKLPNACHAFDDVLASAERSLSDLRCGYLDLYLMHWPDIDDGGGGVDALSPKTLEAWRAMERLVLTGRVRAIGVANFSSGRLRALASAATAPISAVQMEIHPGWRNERAIATARDLGAVVIASMPLGSPDSARMLGRRDETPLMSSEFVVEASNVSKCGLAEVCLRWSVFHIGVAVIPKATSASHLASNWRAVEASKVRELCDESLQALAHVPQRRLGTGEALFAAPSGGGSVLNSLWGDDGW